MSETYTKVGSPEWWSGAADKLLGGALDIVKWKIAGIPSTGNAANTQKTQSTLAGSFTDKIPLILGALAVAGIVVILVKR